MFIAGLISLAQILFLPGLLTLSAIRYKETSPVYYFILAFALSGFINYCLVFLLSFLGIYTRFSMILILIGEGIIFFALYYKKIIALYQRRASIECSFDTWNHRIIKFFTACRKSFTAKQWLSVVVKTGVYIFAIFAIVSELSVSLNQINSVFDQGDALMSWSKWAAIWATVGYPENAAHWPQLLPIHISIPYILQSYPLDFFPKFSMSFFYLGIYGIFYYIAKQKKHIAYIAAIPIFWYLTRSVSYGLISGHADIPVAFFTLLAFSELFTIHQTTDKTTMIKKLVVGALCALASAATKQSGIITALVYPVFAYIMVYRSQKHVVQKQWLQLFAIYITCAAIVLGVTYGTAEYYIAQKRSESEISWVTNGIYGTQTHVERFIEATKLLFDAIQYNQLIALALVASLLASFTVSYIRPITCLVLPYIGIWALFFSYDTRNLLYILPLASISIAFGCLTILQHVTKKMKTLVIMLMLALVILFGIEAKQQTDTYMIQRQTFLKKRVNDPDLNVLLYAYKNTHTMEKKILSGYHAEFLPEFKDLLITELFGAHWLDLDAFNGYLAHPDIGYLLIPYSANTNILDQIKKKIAAGAFSVEFITPLWMFIKINTQ